MPNDGDIFINEDLTKPENRLNMVIFGLLVNNCFRHRFLQALGIHQDAVIYKPADLEGDRPDFAIEDLEGNLVGYIEVEWDQDLEQFERYKRKAQPLEVYSIGGSGTAGHSITLIQLVALAWEAYEDDPVPQLELMVRHLQLQVKKAPPSHQPPAPVQNQLLTPLGQALKAAGIINWGDAPVTPGNLYMNARSAGGLSVRGYSAKSGDKTVSIFHCSSNSSTVSFTKLDHLEDYLPDQEEKLDRWARFLEASLRTDITLRNSSGYCDVAVERIEAVLSRLIEELLQLR